MAWTAPRDWTASEIVTAAICNTHIRDNLTALRTGAVAIASQAANDLIYATGASQFGRLAAGATGQILKGVTSGAPAWFTLNVVQGTTSTPSSHADSTTWVDSGLTVNITPSATTSRVLVQASFAFAAVYSGGHGIAAARLMRGATPLATFARNDSQSTMGTYAACVYLDSPASSSEQTYKIQIQRVSGDGTSYAIAQPNSESSVIVVQEIP